jgi:hypothetical protein
MPVTGYTIFRPDGSQERGEVDWPENPGLELIRALVEPIVEGPMEHVTVLDPAKVDADEVDPAADRRDLFIDEMGHVRATPRPRNEAATRIYRANWMRANPDDHPEDLPDIAGTAVLFDRIVWR